MIVDRSKELKKLIRIIMDKLKIDRSITHR